MVSTFFPAGRIGKTDRYNKWNRRRQLSGAHLRHLAEIGAASGSADVIVDRVREAADEFEQRWRRGHADTKL
jgi:hypothetical protein